MRITAIFIMRAWPLAICFRIRPADTLNLRHVSTPAISLRTLTLAHVRMVKSLKVSTAAMINTMLTNHITVHLLTLCNTGRVLKLTRVESLFDRANNFSQRLTISSAKFDSIIIELCNMSITIVLYLFIRLWRYNYANTIITTIIVKARHVCIMI